MTHDLVTLYIISIEKIGKTDHLKHACSTPTHFTKKTKKKMMAYARSTMSRTAASRNIRHDMCRLNISYAGGEAGVVFSCNARVGGMCLYMDGLAGCHLWKCASLIREQLFFPWDGFASLLNGKLG